jgi:hypothetical protein
MGQLAATVAVPQPDSSIAPGRGEPIVAGVEVEVPDDVAMAVQNLVNSGRDQFEDSHLLALKDRRP